MDLNISATATQLPEYFSLVRAEIETILPDHLGSVLEIGCASGATMAWLRSIRSVEYAMGVEVISEVAAQARAVFDDVIVGSVESVSFDHDRMFDTVIALDVLEHLVDPWTVLRTLSGRLKLKGVFLASIPNVSHWNASGQLFVRGRWNYEKEGILDRTHLRFFTEKTARALFEDNGYTIEKMDYVKAYPNLFIAFGNNAKWRWYSQKVLKSILPARFSNYQFLIQARRIA